MIKKLKLDKRKNIPPVSVTLTSTLPIKTGTWRYFSPVHKNKLSPCVNECPIGQNIPGFIELITKEKFEDALDLIRRDNPFAGVTGRVCYHPCQSECTRESFDGYLAIAALERAAADFGSSKKKRKKIRDRKKRVAIIGAGPAGLSCVYHLRMMGYRITLFEKLPVLGGMLKTGIPDYRLPKEILDREISDIIRLGVNVKTNTQIGKDISIEELEKKYDAVFLATGAHLNRKLGIPGEEMREVLSGLDFLKSINLGKRVKIGKKVVIIGGGNTAFDTARSALRLGKKPTIIYRRSEDQMPAFIEEVEQGIEEEIKILYLTIPIKIKKNRDGGLTIECVRAKLGRADESGRRRPIPIPGSNFTLKADTVISAIGEYADLSYLSKKIECKKGEIVTDENGMSSGLKLFAGGDIIQQPKTVAHAIGSGKRGALAIHRTLQGKSAGIKEEDLPMVDYEKINLDYFEEQKRTEIPLLKPSKRIRTNAEVKRGLTRDKAIAEAKRCFSCGICTLCENCLIFCPEIAVQRNTNEYSVDYDYCKGCGICMQECPRGVITMERELKK